MFEPLTLESCTVFVNCEHSKTDPSVDGSEIRRENLLRLVVEIPLFTRFLYIQTVVGNGISEPSTSIGGLLATTNFLTNQQGEDITPNAMGLKSALQILHPGRIRTAAIFDEKDKLYH